MREHGVLLTGRDAEAGWEVDVDLDLTPEGLVTQTVAVTNTGDDDLVARPGALRPAGGRPRHRAARPHRPVEPGADAAAPAVAGRHPPARGAARPHRPRRQPGARRRGARLRLRARRGVGHPRRVERRPRRVRRAHARGRVPARWRRAAGRRRGGAGAGGDLPLAPARGRLGRRRTGRRQRPAARPRAPHRAAAAAATGAREHLGGVLLRPRPRPGSPRWPTPRPRWASSGSCSTTAGSAAVAPTGPGWGTGPSIPTSGRAGCTRWSSTSTTSAWTSGCGSSPRWSTPTASWCAPTPTGCSAAGPATRRRLAAPAGARPARAGRLRARARRPAGAARRVRHRLPQVGPQPRPRRRRPRRARPDHGALRAAGRGARRPPRARDRVVRQRWRPGRPRRARPHRPGVAQRHHRRARAAADPALDVAARAAGADGRPTSAARWRTPPDAVTRWRSGPPPPCWAASAWSGICAGWAPTSGPSWPGGWRCTRRCGRCSPPAGWCAATTPTRRCCVTGVVAPDRSEGWYVVATIDSTATQTPAPVVLPGLDPAGRYRLEEVTPARAPGGRSPGGRLARRPPPRLGPGPGPARRAPARAAPRDRAGAARDEVAPGGLDTGSLALARLDHRGGARHVTG